MGFISLVLTRENIHLGKPWCISGKGCWKEPKEFGLVLGDFEEDLKQQPFPLDWMLSGSKDNSMIKYLNKSDLERGKTRVKLKL